MRSRVPVSLHVVYEFRFFYRAAPFRTLLDMKPRRLLQVFALLVFISKLAAVAAQGLNIRVSVIDGRDQAICLEGRVPCATLTYAFNGTVGSNTSFFLSPGDHVLNDTVSFVRKEGVTIEGAGKGVTRVVCSVSRSAGIVFLRSSNIAIHDLTVKGCGVAVNDSSPSGEGISAPTAAIVCALYFSECDNVNISSVGITNSAGTGMLHAATTRILVMNCSFMHNGFGHPTLFGGGGLHIQPSSKGPLASERYPVSPSCCDNPSIYHIISTEFFHNKAFGNDSEAYLLPRGGSHGSFGRGGGLSVYLGLSASDVQVRVEECIFNSNEAIWGGGMYVEFQEESRNNSILVSHSFFVSNVAHAKYDNAGGGAHVVFAATIDAVDNGSHGNTVHLTDCHFTGNSVGDLSAFDVGSVSAYPVTSSLVIANSTLSTGTLPNTSLSLTTMSGRHSSVYFLLSNVTVDVSRCFFRTKVSNLGFFHSRSAISLVKLHNVILHFERYVSIECCSVVQGILAVGAQIVVLPETEVNLWNGFASTGGALAFYHSFLTLHPNTLLWFGGNYAIHQGGAVYASFLPSGSELDSLCFIHYHDITVPPQDWDNVTVVFKSNYAVEMGHSIYATSLRNCYQGMAFGPSVDSVQKKREVFLWDSVFQYMNETDSANRISTGPATVEVKVNKSVDNPLPVIPGEFFYMPYDVKNDLGYITSSFFSVELQNKQKKFDIWVNNITEYTDTLVASLHGEPLPFNSHTGHVGNVSLPLLVWQSVENNYVTLSTHITLSCCPPGFGLSRRQQRCVCSTRLDPSNRLHLKWCSTTQLLAQVEHGYWLGYLDATDTQACGNQRLYVAKCPVGFCTFNESRAGIFLPKSATKEALDEAICRGTSRTGVLCGECRTGFASPVNIYGSPCIDCASDPVSQVGWLVFLITEALPLTICVAILLIFDIDILSGPLNSYLVYTQFMAATASVSVRGPFFTDASAIKPLAYLAGLVSIFNAQFFATFLDPFCLSPTASFTSLDSAMFKYLWTLYPFFLLSFIVGIHWLKKRGIMSYVRIFCRNGKSRNHSQMAYEKEEPQRTPAYACTCIRRSFSVTHALAAIYILSYTSFLKYSVSIMKRAFIIGDNGHVGVRVHLQGNLHYFEGKHAAYSLIAIVINMIIIAGPTFVLLIYPAAPRLQERLSNCKLSFLRKLSTNRVLVFFSKPWIQIFADLFQSSYKASGLHRSFAGLLLLFRIAITCTLILADENALNYLITGVLVVGLFIIHSITQPNTKHWINVVDTLIYADLILISFIAAYLQSHSNKHNQELYSALSWMHLAVGIAPSLYLVGLICISCFLWCKNKQQQRKASQTLSSEVVEDSTDEPEFSYHDLWTSDSCDPEHHM